MPRYGNKYISDPDEKIVSQSQLFTNNKNEPNVFPRITTNVADFRSLLSSESLLGTDFEFATKKIAGKEYYSPTIVAVSSPDLTVGLRYSEELARECVRYIERGGRFVAHSGLGADKPVLEGPLGVETPLEAWEDSMVVHYYANQALTKTTSKEVSDDAGALGYMSLSTAASLVTLLPQWKHCLHAKTRVLTSRGWVEIRTLVNNKYKGTVLCVDKTGNLVHKAVTAVHKSPKFDRTFFNINYVNNLSKKVFAVVTNDHQLLTNSGWKAADHVENSDLIATGTPALKNLDLLCGMWLGDGEVTQQFKFRIAHTEPQKEYLLYKRSYLSNIGLLSLQTEPPRKNCNKTNYYRSSTKPQPFFKYLRSINKYDWCLEHFTKRSLALWFLDDGYRDKNGSCSITCKKIPLSFITAVLGKLKNLGLEGKVYLGKSAKRITFNRENSLILSSWIAPYTPPCLRYKLDPLEAIPFDCSIYAPEETRVFYDTALITKSTSVGETVYCLSVQDTENFITRGGVVHNCTGMACYSSGRVCPRHKPIEYCAVDSWAGLMIYLKQWEKLKSFNFSFDFYRSKMALGEICTRMQTEGVKIDTKYVKEFDAKGDEKKELLFDFDLKPSTKKAQKELERLQVPLTLTPEELREFSLKYADDWHLDEDDFTRAYKHFNPRSPQETIRYFKEHGIDLSSTDKKYLQKQLEKIAVSRGLESINDLDDPDNLPEYLTNLYNLWALKNEGKGIKAWFGEQYVDEYGFAHPRWLYTGASSGRLSSSGPNFMNIPARGFGEQLRKAVIPREPGLELYKADKSQLELRMVLHCAGVDQKILGPDAFVSLVEQSGDDFFKAAKAYDPVKYEKDPKTAARNIAKIFSHSNSYLIGIKIIPYLQLDSARVKQDISDGILAVYRKKYIPWLERDWEYGGGIVAFTGKHLAETAYGNDSKENRKKALEMQEQVYFKNDRWGVRRWQMKLLDFVQSNGYAQHSCGSFLELYSSPAEAAKIAAGFIGQGQSAHYMQELMLNYRALGIYPLLQVHDELVFERPRGASDEEVKEFFRPMRSPSKLFDGFSAPIEIKRGPNWKDLKLVGKI